MQTKEQDQSLHTVYAAMREHLNPLSFNTDNRQIRQIQADLERAQDFNLLVIPDEDDWIVYVAYDEQLMRYECTALWQIEVLREYWK